MGVRHPFDCPKACQTDGAPANDIVHYFYIFILTPKVIFLTAGSGEDFHH